MPIVLLSSRSPVWIIMDGIMPIYEYKCRECSKDFEQLFRSFTSSTRPECPSCQSGDVDRKWSKVSFKFDNGSNQDEYDRYYSDSSNIGKNVEESFSKHGVDVPDSVRKSIDNARKGNMPDGLDS